MSEICVSSFITPSWYTAWDYLRRGLFMEYWFTGGRGTGKTTVTARHIIDDILHDPAANWVCYKKAKVEVETSVYAECLKAINRAGLQAFFDCKTSPCEITYRPTGQKIFFRGMDAGAKAKGITAVVGYIKGAWFEEADQFAGQTEIDTVLQSVGRGGPVFKVIYTYNPPISRTHWINREAEKPNPSRYVFHTTYKDWNAEWLGPFFFHKMDAIKAQSERRFEHEYLGIPTGSGDEIFANVRAVDFTPDQVAAFRSKRYGMDFGQGDPTTLVSTDYTPHWVVDARTGRREDIGGTLRVFDAWGKSDALNREVFAAIEARGLLNTRIYGDPGGGGAGVIHEMRDMGVRGIRQAYKPPGSVEKGINWMRQCAVIEIDRSRAGAALDEFSAYAYAKMRDGSNRNEYPDMNNHYIDAVRYSREEDIFGGTGSRLLGI